MSKIAVTSSRVPAPFGFYSSAILKGDMLFISGIVPFDVNRQLVGRGDMAAQSRQVLDNLRMLLEDNGFSLDDVVRSTVYLSDITNRPVFNDVYSEFFSVPYPARTVVGCQLNGFLVEIECTAVRG